MRRRTTRVLAAILVSGITLAGCSTGDHDERSGDASARSDGASDGADAATAARAQVATVTGRLPAAGRDALAEAVGSVVDDWLDAAYLGDFPRSDYSAAFAAFTPGAAVKAQGDLALMTNAAISDRLDKADATSRSVSLDVLAVKQKPVGVTATVDLAFETEGALTGPQEVTGTLDLTPDGDGWKVFAFDITRTPAAPAAPASPTETPESGS
ncbi:hypothetical protein SAMN04487968_101181 [Nocardioides terrae]|uniref:SnoaL-like domain-containing protein n=1 Tax=Nocardioides terrae TaxID=574651 RepID=A0A1I1DJH4_9ACTN|nr:hypothetical protein [Nocardioides terrae]SFB72870.1 hypothetical protein SAMN04487968_101181 [Nocardioides terrae]